MPVLVCEMHSIQLVSLPQTEEDHETKTWEG